jgi:Skp family chaperone for outer membrane proteins
MRTLMIAALLAASSSVALGQDFTQAPKPVQAAAGSVAFPSTTKIAFMDPDRVLAGTAEGRRLGAILHAFRQKKLTELTEKNRQLENLQAKRQQSGGLLAASALESLDRDISKLNVDIERTTQDAEAEYNERVGQVQLEFRKKLQPILIKVLNEHQVNALLTPSAGLGWVDPAIDLTDTLAAQLDQAYPATKDDAPKK